MTYTVSSGTLNPTHHHPSLPPYPPSSHFLTAPSLPLEVRPLDPSRGPGSAVRSPSGFERSPAAKRYFVHLGLKMLLVGHIRENIYVFWSVYKQQCKITYGRCFHRLWA